MTEMTEEIRQRLLELIRKGELGKAISELGGLRLVGLASKEASAIASRYARVQSDNRKGLLNMEVHHRLENEIVAGLVDLLEGMKQDEEREPTVPWWRHRRFRRWAAVFGLFVIVGSATVLAARLMFTQDLALGPVFPPQQLFTYEAVVKGPDGKGQVGAQLRLRSGNGDFQRTDRNGRCLFSQYLSEDQLDDTLEIYRDGVLVDWKAIRFPGREVFLLETVREVSPVQTKGNSDSEDTVKGSNPPPAPIEKHGFVIAGDLDMQDGTSANLSGITIEAQDSNGIPIRGAKAVSDSNGNWRINMPIDGKYPKLMKVDGSLQGYNIHTWEFSRRKSDHKYLVIRIK